MATTPTTRVTQLNRRYRVDIDTGTYPASSYQQLLAIADLKLVEDLRVQDDETYEDAGAAREQVTGYNWRIEGKLKLSTNAAQTVLDTVQAFLRAKFTAGRGSNMPGAEFGVRWYDRNGIDTGDSFEGRAYVKAWPMDGGDAGTQDVISFVIQGQGPLASIANPNASLVPTISGLAPTGGTTAGNVPVQISGSHLTGATAVKFGGSGGTAATNFVVVNDGLIVATAPAHTAGSVQVYVVTPAGNTADTAADDFLYA